MNRNTIPAAWLLAACLTVASCSPPSLLPTHGSSRPPIEEIRLDEEVARGAVGITITDVQPLPSNVSITPPGQPEQKIYPFHLTGTISNRSTAVLEFISPHFRSYMDTPMQYHVVPVDLEKRPITLAPGEKCDVQSEVSSVSDESVTFVLTVDEPDTHGIAFGPYRVKVR